MLTVSVDPASQRHVAGSKVVPAAQLIWSFEQEMHWSREVAPGVAVVLLL